MTIYGFAGVEKALADTNSLIAEIILGVDTFWLIFAVSTIQIRSIEYYRCFFDCTSRSSDLLCHLSSRFPLSALLRDC